MTRSERLQLEAAKERLDAIWDALPDNLRLDISYAACRIEKVLTGHAAHR